MQSMMTNMEKGALVKLFNRGGYVLDFSTPDFDAFTLDSVGVALCQKYGLSKGKSLIAYIDEANPEDSYKLLSDLLEYNIIILKTKLMMLTYLASMLVLIKSCTLIAEV